jgi:Protein of unknown function (DUF2959)
MKMRPLTPAALKLASTGALAAALLGCASTNTTPRQPTLRDDFLEYRQLVVGAMGQVDASLRALDQLEAQAKDHPRPAYKAFAAAVQQLECDSIRVRERTAAMRARGDAYFEHWEEFLSSVPREEVRRLAAEHRADLKKSFDQIKAGAEQARETFRPFLTDLQKLRAVLEANPALAGIDAQKPLVLATKDKGREVQQALDRILVAMNSVMASLTPPAAAAQH